MARENEKTMTSYAIDCNDESRLLVESSIENHIAVVTGQHLIPSPAAMHSLFSENNLLLNQD